MSETYSENDEYESDNSENERDYASQQEESDEENDIKNILSEQKRNNEKYLSLLEDKCIIIDSYNKGRIGENDYIFKLLTINKELNELYYTADKNENYLSFTILLDEY